MRVLFSTGLLGLAWFGAVNLAVSALAWVVSRRMLARRPPVSGVTLLALRLFPSVAASLFVLTVFLPAHVRFEPPQSDERFGVILAGLAAAGVCLLAHSARRLLKVWSAARRSRNWDAVAVASTVGDAFEVNGFSGVSLAGIVRTRILIGSGARETLSPEELALAVAHEHAHRRSLDNLKRCLMFCAPDFFGWTAVSRHVEERWRAKAECDADLRAVAGDERRAVHLASALVKVARRGARPTDIVPSPVWSAFNEPPLLETRIRLLVSGPVPSRPASHRRRLTIVLGAATVPLLALAQAPYRIHQLTEALVAVLP